MGKRIELQTVYRPKKGKVGRKLAVSSGGSDIATDPANVSRVAPGGKGRGARASGEAGSNPARSINLPLSPIPTTATELKAALIAAGLASETDFTTTPKFDRVRYQRDYMRDLTQAKKLGITVAEYRARQKP